MVRSLTRISVSLQTRYLEGKAYSDLSVNVAALTRGQHLLQGGTY